MVQGLLLVVVVVWKEVRAESLQFLEREALFLGAPPTPLSCGGGWWRPDSQRLASFQNFSASSVLVEPPSLIAQCLWEISHVAARPQHVSRAARRVA